MHDWSLSRVPLFAGLPPAELAALEATLPELSFPAQTILFREGDHGDRFYVVLKGRIEVLKAMDSADERLLTILGPNEFVGEMSLLNPDGRRTASVRVIEDACMLVFTRADFDALLHRYPALAYTMLRVLSTRLRDSHDATIRDLHEKNERLARAYADLQAAQAQLVEQETLKRELQLARVIQESMLPHRLPHTPGLDVGARMVPARMVGGDFFDVITLGPETLAVVIGDVSGKGIPAALFMALTCSLLRAEALRGTPPEEVLRSVNRNLRTMNARGMFVTVLYGVFHLTTYEFAFVRAGHDLPLIWGVDRVPRVLTPGHGQPLGLFPEPVLDAQTAALARGDSMLLYTDGVTEARAETGEFFGIEGLHTAIHNTTAKSAQQLCDELVTTVAAYHGPVPQSDDITLVALRVC